MPLGLEKMVYENAEYLHLTNSMEKAVEDADVVMMLRVQFERMNESFFPSVREYFRYYGLTSERASRARPDVIIMHPGPMNRGVESHGCGGWPFPLPPWFAGARMAAFICYWGRDGSARGRLVGHRSCLYRSRRQF
jgi:hypothetical protein